MFPLHKYSEKPVLISCGILRKELEMLLQRGEIDANVHFLNERLHVDYDRLKRALNGTIKKTLKRSPKGIVVVYGDVCLGFNGEMKRLMDQYHVTKVDALNCIDCLLGGRGKLLETDPDHKYLFLNPAWIQFFEKRRGTKTKISSKAFSMLEGIVLLDAMDDLDGFQSKIDRIAKDTGLPVLERKRIDLDRLKNVLLEALRRNRERIPGTERSLDEFRIAEKR